MATLVIQEVYGGGGSNATSTNPTADYVVLHNTGDTALSLAGMALQVSNGGVGTGGQNNPFTVIALTGTVDPFGYFLIQVSLNGVTGTALPTPDFTYATGVNLGPNSGRVALTTDTVQISNAAGNGTGPTIVDFVGYGTSANNYEGSGAASGASGTQAIVRTASGGWDTNDNLADFAAAAPNPLNSASPPLNATPSITSSASASIAENSTATILDINAFDPEGATEGAGLTYSLVGSDDDSLFTIDSTGALSFIAGADFEAGTGHGANPNEYKVTVRVTDNGGALAAQSDQVVTITVTDTDEFNVSTPSDVNTDPNTVDENTTGLVNITANASDDDGSNNTVTYSLVTDITGTTPYTGGKLSIDTNGVVSLIAALDYEVDGPTLDVFVKATSADTSTSVAQFTITVNDVSEAVSTPVDANAAANAIAEGATGLVGITASATDPDATNNTVTYSLVTDLGGATPYSGPFAIDGTTGVVSLTTALDYETGGPTQTIFVKATSADGSSAVQSFTVAIGNVTPEMLIGTAAADILSGSADADLIFGLGGKDRLYGFDGNDVLTGGALRDILTGGAGSDTFDFNSRGESKTGSAGRDRITDFTKGQDKIDLSGIDARSGVANNQKFTWIGKQDFHDKKGELHYFQVNVKGTAGDKTIVEGDVNGDGRADFQIELAGLHKLGSGDFIL